MRELTSWEIWQTIEGYEGLYEISNLGNVKSLSKIKKSPLIGEFMTTERILKPGLREGYLSVSLTGGDGLRKSLLVHRLIAGAFIPNPNNHPCINHINAVRSDNRIENLEWCTYSHNNKQAYITGSNYPTMPGLGKIGSLSWISKPVLQFGLNGLFIKEWSCASEVTREIGISNRLISRCCHGELKKSKGFIWKFKN